MDKEEIEREKIRRLISWKKGKRAPPVKIDLEPTSSCNLKCKFCWARSAKRFGSRQYDNLLSEKRILEVVKEAVEFGVIDWQIAGGWEPLMKPDLLFEIAKVIKQNGAYGCITTNGTLFSNRLIKNLVKIGWDEILFSIEGPNARIHDYLTGVKGSFKRAIEAMKKFKYWKKVLKANKPKYSFHSVLTNKNFNKLAEMVKLGFKLGCEGINFEPLSVWSEDGAKLKLNKKQELELRKYVKEALKVANDLGIYTNVANLLQPKLVEKNEMDKILLNFAKKFGRGKLISSPCFEPWLSAEIRITGRVAPCRLCDDDAICETLHEKSLEEIWFGEFFENFRKDMMNWKMPRYCYTCAAGVVLNTIRMREKILNS
jgi:MoaA/NifB/PqqE/SkfB family radical SAM enzyme